MDNNELKRKLLEGLLELEKLGEIVITNPNPSLVADHLKARIVEAWASEFIKAPPYEVVIESSIESSTRYLVQEFSMQASEARIILEKFINHLSGSRTLMEVSDLVSHQGYQEIAFGAYYCFNLMLGSYYSTEYLNWRKEIYSSIRNK